MCIKRKVLAPKIYEVSEFLLRHQIDLAFILLRHQIDLAFITETWLKESIDDSVVSISGYCFFRRDRKTDCHAGVCTYVNTERLNNFTVLDDLNCCEQRELLWLRIRPLEEYRLQCSSGTSGRIQIAIFVATFVIDRNIKLPRSSRNKSAKCSIKTSN